MLGEKRLQHLLAQVSERHERTGLVGLDEPGVADHVSGQDGGEASFDVHIRGAPRHPQTQGKIERWHRTLKNRILLEHYYLPGDLETQIGALIEPDNHARAHESPSHLSPADVYLRRSEAILLEGERIN